MVTVHLTWTDNSIGETEQRIYRSTSTINPAALPAPLATVGADVTTYADTTAVDDTTYYYRVAAVGVSGVVAVSSEYIWNGSAGVTLESFASGQTGGSGITSTQVVAMPSGVQAGDLLVVYYGQYQTGSTTPSAGWSTAFTGTAGGRALRTSVFYKVAEGSDTLTVTHSQGTSSSWTIARYSGADSVAVSSLVGGQSTTQDPPAVTLPASVPAMFNTFVAVQTGTFGAVTHPTPYQEAVSTVEWAGAGFATSTSVGFRTLEAASDDPDVVTTTNNIMYNVMAVGVYNSANVPPPITNISATYTGTGATVSQAHTFAAGTQHVALVVNLRATLTPAPTLALTVNDVSATLRADASFTASYSEGPYIFDLAFPTSGNIVITGMPAGQTWDINVFEFSDAMVFDAAAGVDDSAGLSSPATLTTRPVTLSGAGVVVYGVVHSRSGTNSVTTAFTGGGDFVSTPAAAPVSTYYTGFAGFAEYETGGSKSEVMTLSGTSAGYYQFRASLALVRAT